MCLAAFLVSHHPGHAAATADLSLGVKAADTSDLQLEVMQLYGGMCSGLCRELQLREEEFRFVGKKGGKTVVEEPYVLTADCCHVAKKSGAGETVIRPQ